MTRAKMLTIEQAAERVDVHPNSIRSWISKHGLPSSWDDVERRRKIKQSDLDSFQRPQHGGAR